MKVTSEQYLQLFKERVQETSKLQPQVSIQLKGNSYVLEYNNSGIIQVLKDKGLNLLTQPITKDMMYDPVFLGYILYIGLGQHHPDLTEGAANELFTLRHYAYISNRIKEALDAFMPDLSDLEVSDLKEEGEEEEQLDPPSQLASAG